MKPPVYINYDCFLEKGLQDQAHFANNCPPKVSINTLKHLAVKAKEI